MSKEFTIENEYLKLTVTTNGAQITSVVRKCDGVEHMWQAGKPKASVTLAFPKVWEGCHLQPLLFDVLEVLASKLDKNKIQNVIYRLP